MEESKFIQVIAIAGAKGGTGKTTLTVNLALALASTNKRVIVLDASFELPDIDIKINTRPKKTIKDLVDGSCSISEIIHYHPSGVSLILGSHNSELMQNLSNAHHFGIINSFSDIHDDYDILLIDTASGISQSNENFLKASQEIIIVISNDNSSISSAYSLIKKLCSDSRARKFNIITNRTQNELEGRQAFNKLFTLFKDNIEINLKHTANITEDITVRHSTYKNKATFEVYPNCKFTKEILKAAKELVKLPHHTAAKGNIEFFMDKLIKTQFNSNIKPRTLRLVKKPLTAK